MSILTAAKVALCTSAGEVLILRRSGTDPKFSGGANDFPGGTVEAGEDILAAVVREVAEEVGITITAHDLRLGYASSSEPNAYGHIIHRLLFFCTTPSTNVVLSWEHDAYWWLKPQDIKDPFDNIAWSEGLTFIMKHELLAE